MTKVIDLYGSTKQFNKDNTKVFISKNVKVIVTKNKQCIVQTSIGTYNLEYDTFSLNMFRNHKYSLLDNLDHYQGIVGNYKISFLHKTRFAELHYTQCLPQPTATGRPLS